MFVPGLAKTLSLWIAVVVLGHHAYHSASRAVAVDLRRHDGLLWIGGAALIGGLLAVWAARRRPTRWSPLGADRWALALLMAAIALQGFSHVEGFTSIRVIREQIPPAFAPLFPLWAGLVPIWLAATGRRLSAADQALRLLTLVLAAGTALFLLPGAAALTLAVPVMFLQFRDGVPRPRGLLWLPLASVALLVLATLNASTPLLAAPTLPWALASLCLLLGIAARPRDASDVRALVAVAIGAPLLVAFADVLLTAELAQQVSWSAALHTRPTLFRQHPNFLAPLFAVGCLLAASLAWSTPRRRVPALLAALLLAAATWHTDSNAGKGALLIGLALLPALRLALPFARKLPLTRLALAGVALLVLLAAAAWFLRDSPSIAPLTERLDRFEKSLDYRLDAWRNSLRVIEEQPWLGLGPGTFVSVERFAPESRFFNEPTSPHPHNVFLYIAQAGGLPCLALVLAWLVGLFVLLGRAASEPTRSRLGRPLALGLLATLLALLGANLLDLGLALETVVPGPVFLITGLALAARVRDAAPDEADVDRTHLRAGPALLGCALLLVPWWTYGVRPTRADTLFERAQHRAFLAVRADDGEALKSAALTDLTRAVELDHDHFAAHDLLARWTEQLPGGHVRAHEVLQQLVARAPQYGAAHSLLAQFYLRLGDDVQAAESLRRAVDDRHGSANLRRDRARLIETLARLGQRDQTFELLVDYLQLEAALVHEIRWQGTPGSDDLILPVERGAQRPIRLVDAVATLYERQKRDELAGKSVGRRFWMDTPNAFRFVGRDDLALDVYAWLEANAERIDFVKHNLHVLAGERGHLAADAGDLPAALAQFERAAELSADLPSKPFYVTQAENVRQRMTGGGAETATTRLSEADAAAAFASTGEILDQPTALRDNLNTRAAARLREDDPGGAARLLEKSLLYHDELAERTELLERVATLHLQAEDAQDAERVYLRSLRELDAKPLPLSTLLDGLADTQPARIARGLCAAWRAQGIAPRELLPTAWARVRRYTSPHTAMALVRIEIARESGRADQLDREAALALLDDPYSTPAMWARLEAHEAHGQRDQLHAAMAPLAEQFAGGRDPEARIALLVKSLMPRESEARTWREIGIARLLQGRYREAAGLFRSAQERVPEGDVRELSELIGWEARALLLSGQVDATRRRLHEALRIDPARPLFELRMQTLGPASPAEESS